MTPYIPIPNLIRAQRAKATLNTGVLSFILGNKEFNNNIYTILELNSTR